MSLAENIRTPIPDSELLARNRHPAWWSSVEPFRVICETCHARLKVGSASVVGEIHACPKCGSMVQIKPPTDSQLAPPIADNSASLEIGAVVVPAFANVTAPTVELVEPLPTFDPITSGTPSFLLWGVVGAAVLTVGGLLAVMLSGGRGTAADPAPVAKATTTAPVTEDDSVQSAQDAPSIETANEQPDPYAVERTAAAAGATDSSPTPPALPELPAAEVEPVDTGNNAAVEAVNDSSSAPPVTREPLPSSAPPAEESPRAAVLSFDPLDFDPTQLRLTAGAPSSDDATAGSIPAESDVEAETAPAPSIQETPNEIKLPLPARDLSLTVRRGPIASGTLPPHQLAQRLAMRLESLDVSDMPLSRFVEMLSDVADVPVTLDPVALELAGKSPRQPITVNARDVALEQLLRDALVKHRLDVLQRDGHVRLALAGSDRRSTVDYDVRDLAGPDGPQPLASLIEHLVAPPTWKSAGGTGTIGVEGTKLRVDNTQSIRHEVLIFCERLRLARGLTVRSRYPVALLSVDSPYAKLAPKLKQRATFTFLPWTRLADVLRYWQDTTGVTIVADWESLADAELGPSSPIACSAINRPWEEALVGILEPLGLTWWAVNGETIQITSREALDDVRRFEFYAVPKSLRDQFANDEALLDSLRAEVLTDAARSRATIDAMQFEVDEPSGRLIVLAPPQVHRFLSQRLRAATN